VTQDRATPNSGANPTPYQQMVADSHYAVLGIQPAASAQQIRQSYRDLSKLYHPDTTTLAATAATSKFQQLNEAYATLSNPERRRVYDQKIGYSRVAVVQPLPSLKQTARPPMPSSAYLDATDRALSPGEMFAIFILGLTVVGCLVLAIAIGITRGPAVFEPVTAISPPALGPQDKVIETVRPAIVPQTIALPSSQKTPPLVAPSRVPVVPIESSSGFQLGETPHLPGETPQAEAPQSPRLPSAADSPERQHLSPKALNSVQVNSVPAASPNDTLSPKSAESISASDSLLVVEPSAK
jgi:DnaJ domain